MRLNRDSVLQMFCKKRAQFVWIGRFPLRGKKVQPDMIFKHLCQQTVNSAFSVCEEYENGRAVVTACQGTFDGINLPSDPFDAGNQFLLFFIYTIDLLVYRRGI